MKPFLVDVYPEKAQFLRAESLVFAAEIYNPFQHPIHVGVNAAVRNLLEIEDQIFMEVELGKKGVQEVQITIRGKDVVFRGYGVEVQLWYENELLGELSSAFDVVDDYRRSTRYGFLADFGPGEKEDREDVANLVRLHLNLVQFYDWMYRHDTLLPPHDEFEDPMGKHRSLATVKAKIALCHERGIKAVAYGAVYAASHEFYASHPDWALSDAAGKPIMFIDRFHIMDISPDCPWHGHIISEYRKAIEDVGFDGIHMDAYGFPKAALSCRSSGKSIVRLDDQFPLLIDNARLALSAARQDVFLVFNNVCNWPVETTAAARQDAVYVEMWEPHDRYEHLADVVRQAQHLGRGKPVILAAYLAPFQRDDLRRNGAALSSFLFLTAVIASHGAYHLMLGESRGVLTKGYYVEYQRLTEDEFITVRRYYDFLVRYCILLYDPELRDVSMTHCGGDNKEYQFFGFEHSLYGQPGKVWCIIREKHGLKTVNLLNFCGVRDDRWNDGKETPPPLRDLGVTIRILESVESVFVASPDIDSGKPQRLAYEVVDGHDGMHLRIRIPELRRWSLLAVLTGS